MKKAAIITTLMLVTFICSAQLNFKLNKDPLLESKSLMVVKQETRPMNLHLKKDNGPKVTATVVYLSLNGIVALNQFTSPPNVQKDLLPAYIGTIALTTVAYGLFLILN